MNNFLDELRHEIDGCGVYECPGIENNLNQKSLDKCFAMIDSLGENARRMLEIGILQDELVKLEFGLEIFNKRLSLTTIDSMFNEKFHHVQFWTNCVAFRGEVFYYKSPTWQQDVLTRVKEMTNE